MKPPSEIQLNPNSIIVRQSSVSVRYLFYNYYKMAATDIGSADHNPPEFSEPWKFSDVVLVVEDQRFHVHRNILMLWSPVFEKMFASEFQEKNKQEIPLPGKKPSEIKELLQMMYPSLDEKLVTKDNCYFLLELAHEYQIFSIGRKSEDFMVSMVETKTEDDLLQVLIFGQKYQLKKLIAKCIYEARRLTLNELKQHAMRDQIEPDNYVQITEGIIERLEEQCKMVKDKSFKELFYLSRSLYYHAKYKGGVYYLPYGQEESTDRFLDRLKQDVTKNIECNSLADVAFHVKEVKAAIEILP